MHVAFPFALDGRGRTALAAEPDYVRQLVEQLLFTAPGERVNRPDVGTGLARLVFEPNSEELRTAVEYLIAGGLQRWLADLVQVQTVAVDHSDGRLQVRVEYLTLRDSERTVVTLQLPAVQPPAGTA